MTREEFDKKLKNLKASKEDMQWVKSMVREMEEEQRAITIIKLNAIGKSIEEISKECEVEIEKVEEIIKMFTS